MASPSSPSELLAFDPQALNKGQLLGNELLWRDHYHMLKDHGYTLRPRYHPDWVASWLNSSKSRFSCEDGMPISAGQVLDATRADGSLVMLKRINISRFPHEITVGKHFSSEPLASNPQNHCVSILDVIQPLEGSNIAFVVMPLLFYTEFAPFETIGEVVEFFRQIFEGLKFMHENNVAHGYDISVSLG